MRSFEWIDATSITQVSALLAASTQQRPVLAKAGGMDLLDLMKEGIVAPACIVNLRGLTSLQSVQFDEHTGLRIGALVTLAQIAHHPLISERYEALAHAAGHAATPQVRNAATLGGNLLQRPRCWYFRNLHFHEAADVNLAAAQGENQYHAIFDNRHTAMVHASTPATALLAYDASVELTSSRGTRVVAIRDFFLPPDMKRSRDTVIAADEVLTHITMPALSSQTRMAYHKQTERDSYDWPICDVAVTLQMHGGLVESAAIALGWVAPTPRRATSSEAVLVGRTVNEAVAREAARVAVQGATPLARNAYKVAVLEAVVKRTLLAAG